MPKVSIIIPVYNTEKFVKKCVESCLNQTLKDIEIICINDGSTDNSSETIKELAEKDNRIIFISQKNYGVSVARNKGLDIAKSEYIMFVDSDDYIEQDMVEIYYNKMIEDNVDLICGYFTNIAGDDFEVTKKRVNSDKCEQYILEGKYYFSPNILEFVFVPYCFPVCKLYKKSIIKKFNIYFPENLINEDNYFLWIYLVHIKTFFQISDDNLYKRNLHADSIMANLTLKDEKLYDRLIIYKKIMDYLVKYKLFDLYKKAYLRGYNSVINCINLRVETMPPEKEVIKENIDKQISKIKMKKKIFLIFAHLILGKYFKEPLRTYLRFPFIIQKIYRKVCL